jgi:hypothetical protein
MEINGRFWGSLQLAIDAGMNFPRLLFEMAAGEAVNPLDNNYRTGIMSRWLLGDLDHLLMRIFKSADSLNLPPNYPAKWVCILDFARSFNGATYNEIERFTDMRPALKEWVRYAGNLL